MQMKTRLSQGRNFLNFVRDCPNFKDGASKLWVEITIKKEWTVLTTLNQVWDIRSESEGGLNMLVVTIPLYVNEVECLLDVSKSATHRHHGTQRAQADLRWQRVCSPPPQCLQHLQWPLRYTCWGWAMANSIHGSLWTDLIHSGISAGTCGLAVGPMAACASGTRSAMWSRHGQRTTCTCCITHWLITVRCCQCTSFLYSSC